MYSNNYFNKMKPNLTRVLANDMTYNNFQKEFDEGTKNHAIFQLNAPYDNPYQGTGPRWLFVCSAGLLRSPTGAAEAVRRGINARSCGSNFNYALIPLSSNLIAWATNIIFVNRENYDQALFNFSRKFYEPLHEAIREKAIILNIPDNFEYGNTQLIKHFDEQLFQEYGPVTGM